VLAGICSGAVTSFQTALQNSRAKGVILINPGKMFFGNQSEAYIINSTLDYYLRTTSTLAGWRKLLQGRVDWAAIALSLAVLFKRVGRRVLQTVASRSSGGSLGGLAADLDLLSRRGADVMLVYSKEDPGLSSLRQEYGREIDGLIAAGKIRTEIIAGADHTFTQGPAQCALQELLAANLLRRIRARRRTLHKRAFGAEIET
jgi:hypothetical protein